MPTGLLGARNLSLGVNTFEEMVGAIAVSPSLEERSSKREDSLRTKGTGGLEEEALADKSTGL